MTTAVVFIGHGTRDLTGQRLFYELTEQIEEVVRNNARAQETSESLEFHRGFLELAEPLIDDVLQRVSPKAQRIILVPLLLFTAQHMLDDVPRLAEQARLHNERINVSVTPAIGVASAFVEALNERLLEAGYDADQCAHVLLVGRGGEDVLARAGFLHVAERFQVQYAISDLHVSFLAGPEPRFEAVATQLNEVLRDDFCYVVPYLLFPGYLTTRMERFHLNFLAKSGNVKFRIAKPLGIHSTIVDRFASLVQLELGGQSTLISGRGFTSGC